MADEHTSALLAQFGLTVRRLRSERGLSQERLADVAGLHRTYVGEVERGLRNVSLVNLDRIARALEIDLSQLLAEVEGARRP